MPCLGQSRSRSEAWYEECSLAARGDWYLLQSRAVVDKQQSEQVYKFLKENQNAQGKIWASSTKGQGLTSVGEGLKRNMTF